MQRNTIPIQDIDTNKSSEKNDRLEQCNAIIEYTCTEKIKNKMQRLQGWGGG